MSPFDEAFERTVGIEGAYVNDPADGGGETKFGITAAVAKANGYVGSMVSMPIGVAREIYLHQYWNLLRLDEVADVSRETALELFDTAVNCGQVMAIEYLQAALNAFNRQGDDYPDVKVDGLIGPMTIAALRSFFRARGHEAEPVLLKALNALQGAGYIHLAEVNPRLERFTFGWFAKRVA